MSIGSISTSCLRTMSIGSLSTSACVAVKGARAAGAFILFSRQLARDGHIVRAASVQGAFRMCQGRDVFYFKGFIHCVQSQQCEDGA
jgi:hypothetical protein